MAWIAVLFALVVSLGALAYVVAPLLKAGPAPVLVEDDRLADLLSRRDAVMVAIKELEFDYQVGKFSDEDYQRFDQRLRRQAIGLMQQIEEIVPESASLDAALESEIVQRRKVQDRQAPSSAPAPQPAPVRPPPPTADMAGVRYCTNCGNALDPNHKFCANCGTPVAAASVAVSN